MASFLLVGRRVHRFLLFIALLLCPWFFAFATPTDPTREAALAGLSDTFYGHRTTTPGLANSCSINETIYWLWAVNQTGLSPDDALNAVAQRAGKIMYEPLRRQVMTDWRFASDHGLLTLGNLALMRQKQPPTATGGRFIGQRIDTVRIDGHGSYDLTNMAFCPAGQPLPSEAVASVQYTAHDLANLPEFNRPFASSPAPTPGLAAATPTPPPVTTVHLSAPAGPPVGDRVRVAPTFTPVPVPMPTSATPVNASAPTAARIELHDIPFNGLLPVYGRIKLGITRVTNSEITYSIVGENDVYIGPNTAANNHGINAPAWRYPSVHTGTVTKTNAVHLPGVSGNAYLLQGTASVQYYYIDTTLNNGTVFRVATVTNTP
ncbi:MAG: hypothetical protein INR62_12455 [Rhodospirillales bacterium]|nr:hypothetical protein [Acetobacter sp.]